MKKNGLEIMLDYLDLDKCKDDKERAVKLFEDINRRNEELKQVKERYKTIRAQIIGDYKERLVKKYPTMDFSAQNSGELLCTKVMVEKLHGYLSICESAKKLSCIIHLDIEESRKGKKLSMSFISGFKDLFEYYTPMYKMYQDFDTNDFEGVIDCFCKALERLQS